MVCKHLKCISSAGLILYLSITMPEMNGLDALLEIMRIDPNAKIIMCSAVGQQIAIVEALQIGAKDFIIKPFHSERIIEAITKTLKDNISSNNS